MLTGIPCCHALSAMKFFNVDPVNFISFWFKKETYVEVYNSIIYPVNGEQVWDKTEMPDVVPPPTKKMFERSKKKRRLEAWEVMKKKIQLGQTRLKKKCGICHKLGTTKSPALKNHLKKVQVHQGHLTQGHMHQGHLSKLQVRQQAHLSKLQVHQGHLRKLNVRKLQPHSFHHLPLLNQQFHNHLSQLEDNKIKRKIFKTQHET